LLDLVEGGGLECCVKKQAMVQQNGCPLMGNLLSIPRLRKSVVDQGGLKAVVYALEKYPQDPPLQLDGCGAFDFLLTIEFSWAKAAADSGCIELDVSAMNEYPVMRRFKSTVATSWLP
jgi:hypothetical protein